MKARPCPAECGRPVQFGKLLCLPCWRQVPKDLQRDVNRTWTAYNIGGTTEQRSAYWTARQAALASLGGP